MSSYSQKVNPRFNDRDLWVYPEPHEYEVGMETTYLGSSIVEIERRGGILALLIKGSSTIDEETLKLTGGLTEPLKASYLEPALRNSVEFPARTNLTGGRYKSRRVLNPNVLRKIFFGTYDFNMCFMLNLYSFLKKNPEFEGLELYEIVHITIQDSVKKCERVSREAKHEAYKTDWHLVPYVAPQSGLELG